MCSYSWWGPGSAGVHADKGTADANGQVITSRPAEPALEPALDAGKPTLRRQVLEINSEVLADSDPQKARARAQLHALLAAQPDEPEQALLRHLMTTDTLWMTRTLIRRPNPPGSAAARRTQHPRTRRRLLAKGARSPSKRPW